MNNNYPVTTENTKSASDEYFIVFSLRNKSYAINIKNVIEVINMPPIEIPETMPKGITGFFNYKGIIIKTVDLCPLLGFESNKYNINSKLIIINIQGTCLAIHTDTIINIFSFENSHIHKIPYSVENSILKNVYENGNESICIIDNEIHLITQTKWNTLNIMNLKTKEMITDINRDEEKFGIDYFHSNLLVSKDYKYFLSNGWVWNPVDCISCFKIDEFLKGYEKCQVDVVNEYISGYNWDRPFAFIDNKMIAWIFLSVSNRMKELKQMIPNIKGNCADIDGVIVLPECRGYGLQKILVKYLEEKAREKGISNIIAEVTFENVYSLRNLKDLGYEEQTWYQKDENIKRYILLKKLGEEDNE